MWIKSRYEELVVNARRDKILAEIDNVYQGTEIDELLEEINSVHPNITRKSDGKPARKIIVELADLEVIPDEGYPEFITNAAHALKDRKRELNKRNQYFVPKRLHGETQGIRETVAKEATNRYGVAITATYVRWIIDDREGKLYFSK